jgi:molybdenum cofactor synthesis domain-containing protein
MPMIVVIAVGRELLTGRVLDANTQWLARRLRALGARLGRAVAVDDDVGAIAREVRRALEDGARLIITTGGLGPTRDDLTLAGIAEAVGLPQVLSAQARPLVEARYRALAEAGAVSEPSLTASREKMAMLPEGARPLPNPVGAAPGLVLEAGGALIVSLPGVPGEMRAIFDGSVEALVRARLGGVASLDLVVATGERDESRLAELLARVMAEVPGSYLKSRPTRFGRDVSIEVIVTGGGESQAEARSVAEAAAARLREHLDASRSRGEARRPEPSGPADG